MCTLLPKKGEAVPPDGASTTVIVREVGDWAGNPVTSFQTNTVVRRHFSDIDRSAYRSDLLEVEVYRNLPTQSNPGLYRLRLAAAAEYEYDQHPLTDRGAAVGQASGYGRL